MLFIILGAGRRGFMLAKYLINEHYDVVVIDSNEKKNATLQDKLDCMTCTGNGTDLEVLTNAGCGNAHAFVAVSDSDEINLVSCGIVSSNFPSVQTIAVIRNLGYKGLNKVGNQNILGITNIINPIMESAHYIDNLINHGIFDDVVSFHTSHLILYNIFIDPSSPFRETSIAETRKKIDTAFIVAALRKNEKIIIPSGDTLISEGDTLSVVTNAANIRKLQKQLYGENTTAIRRILIVGAGSIAFSFLSNLSSLERKHVTIIEKDAEIAENVSAAFPEPYVINSDITEEHLFEDEHLTDADLLLAITQNDELNIITACYAKRSGIKRTIALIRKNNNYLNIAKYLDVDVAFSITESTVNSIIKCLRGNNIDSIHQLFDGQLEIFEFRIGDDNPCKGKKLSQLSMKGKGIIAGVTSNNGSNIIPSGSYVLTEGDTIIVSTTHQSEKEIERMFVDD